MENYVEKKIIKKFSTSYPHSFPHIIFFVFKKSLSFPQSCGKCYPPVENTSVENGGKLEKKFFLECKITKNFTISSKYVKIYLKEEVIL